MKTLPQAGTLFFQCNICAGNCEINMQELGREGASCPTCSSSARVRALIRALSIEMFEQNLILPEFPERGEIKGLGMTDWEGYAIVLARKFQYENTYFHKEPRLDIAASEFALWRLEAYDFIISSEVFEHIVAPVGRAFKNVFKLLKPGGIFILTVPYGTQPTTIEHFPELNEFKLIEDNGSYRLRNVSKEGILQEFDNLIFHGGPGSTLEMRIFAETDLHNHLQSAGFEAINMHREPDFSHGVWWPQPWSFPISARKPKV
jgi:SAM-dependent methyltransferase